MTNIFASKRTALVLKVGVPLAGAAVLAAACSSGSSSGSTAAQTSSASSTAGGGGTSAATVNVGTSNGTSYLTDSAGRALYLWVPDTSTKSTCFDACATAWPPLTTQGAPTSGHGAKASDLSTISRPDGTKQVTYAGHPLYYFAGDSGPGQTNGEGNTSFGAPWYLVALSGKQITSLTASR